MLNKTDDSYNIDNFIIESFDTYRILYVLDEKDYYSDKETNDLIKDFYQYIIQIISPMFLKYLTLIYNAKQLDNIINEKISLIIINFVTEHNSGQV